MGRKKLPNGERKFQVPIGLSKTEIKFLDKQKERLKLRSRSSVIRYVICKWIEKKPL